ncbi:hypothetical protein [Sinomonas halotolerans]|uniref:Uncharacterized protein n=1 Tax=Sinomonas halotolerans TaxID=1644133 RepID=A0ABU9X083_9MICC
MSITQEPLPAPAGAHDGQAARLHEGNGYENPFSEALTGAEPVGSVGLLPWTESLTPFAERAGAGGPAGGADALYAEALEGFRDEAFAEAVADLVAETAEAVDERFEGEAPGYGTERERIGDAHLAPLGLEAERYLGRLEERLSLTDAASLSEEQFDALLDGMDTAGEVLTPAGEEFLGSLVRKAKKAVKFVAKAARKVAGTVAGPLLRGVLARLKGLVRPLLQRVLSFAIGRLPAPLQPAARALASRIRFEAESLAESEWEAEWEAEASADTAGLALAPALPTDPELLAESFDAVAAEALAEAAGAASAGQAAVRDLALGEEPEAFAGQEGLRPDEGRELEALAAARAELIDRIAAAGEDEDLAPAVEEFVPALLAALRVGIRLVGRPRVVGFLAKYVAQLIGRWTGPQLAGPLSNAVVDAGLRLLQLESPSEESEWEAAPTVLAATVEDTVRRLAEAEDYTLDNEDLLQLAVAEAFEQAVATNFPSALVRPGLQQAPTLGGSFITRRARSAHPFRRYTRIPEVEVTPQVAEAVRTFGGATLAAALRSAGFQLPLRARVHIYEAVTGTTLPRIAARDRGPARSGGGPRRAWRRMHPLTPQAAGLLLREPRLGVAAPAAFLQSRGRVAAGQRFYVLEPLGAAAAARPLAGAAARPSQPRVVVDLPQARIDVVVHLADADAQGIAAAVRQGAGTPALLQALSRAFRGLDFSRPGRGVVLRREAVEGEELSPAGIVGQVAPSVLGALRRRVRQWYLAQLAQWARTRAEEFARAAAQGRGVTVRVELTAVPGLALVHDAVNGRLGVSGLRKAMDGSAFSGAPQARVTVVPGSPLP